MGEGVYRLDHESIPGEVDSLFFDSFTLQYWTQSRPFFRAPPASIRGKKNKGPWLVSRPSGWSTWLVRPTLISTQLASCVSGSEGLDMVAVAQVAGPRSGTGEFRGLNVPQLL